jgi:uncharacterized protein (DUF1778 family)
MKKAKPPAARKQRQYLIWCNPTEAEKEKIRLAAAVDGLPMSQFVLRHALVAAEKNLAKIRNQA